MRPKKTEDIRIGINDAARILGVRTSVLKQALQDGSPVNGKPAPKPLYTAGSGGLVFRLGDVMESQSSTPGER